METPPSAWMPGVVQEQRCPAEHRHGPIFASYLGVPQTREVWVQVKLNSLGGPRQRHPSNQQDHQHEVREGGCEVHHLAEGQRRR